jgi:hypothetical protein
MRLFLLKCLKLLVTGGRNDTKTEQNDQKHEFVDFKPLQSNKLLLKTHTHIHTHQKQQQQN